MAKIYVVTGSCGEYSDRDDWNIVASFSEDHAKSLVDKLRKISEFNKGFRQRMMDEFEATYSPTIENPPRQPERPRQSEELRALSSLKKTHRTPDTTERLRILQEEYDGRKKEFDDECRKISTMHMEAQNVLTKAREDWRKKNYNLPPELEEVSGHSNGGNYYQETRYDYEEIEVI